jgi:hypothetical protein
MKKACNYIFYILVGACLGAMVYANVDPDKTLQQTTSAISGK